MENRIVFNGTWVLLLIQILLAVARLNGTVEWNWFIVLIPVLMPVGLLTVIGVIILLDFLKVNINKS